MQIRPATIKDIDEVKRIVDALQVTREQVGWQDKKTGFFEYPKSKDELIEAINPYFVVAETTNGIRGYSLAYTDCFLKQISEGTDDLDWKFLLENINGSYLYLDQIGVLNPGTLGSGRFASSLLDFEINSAKEQRLQKVIAYVCEKPIFNERSFQVLRRRGFERFGDVQIENDIFLGVHRLNL